MKCLLGRLLIYHYKIYTALIPLLYKQIKDLKEMSFIIFTAEKAALTASTPGVRGLRKTGSVTGTGLSSVPRRETKPLTEEEKAEREKKVKMGISLKKLMGN